MPRKRSDKKLEKIVSTTLTLDDYQVLKKYAKIRYNNNRIELPTISHQLRFIIENWSKKIRELELKQSESTGSTSSSP